MGNKIANISIVLLGIFWVAYVVMALYIPFQPEEVVDNVIILQMDESCYTQFTNNMDKALYLQLKFEGGE